MQSIVRTAALVVAASTVTACSSPADAPRSAATERADSAGVEIVTVRVTDAALGDYAVLDSVPELRLGALDGRPEEQFGAVTDLAVLEDGGVAVLDGQASEVKVFDGSGGFVRVLGGEGQGPGELASPIAVGLLTGDTIAVYDADAERITRYALDASGSRTTTLSDVQSRIIAAAFLEDGRMTGQSRWLAGGEASIPGPELTLMRDTAVLTLFGIDGTVADTIDVVPGRETLTSVEMSDRGMSIYRLSTAFGPTNVFALDGDAIWSSSNDRFELRRYDIAGGGLGRIVRVEGLDRPASEELAANLRARALQEAETPEDRRRAETWFDRSPRPEHRPAFDALVADAGGRLWVRSWSVPEERATWWVFGSSGDLLGSVDAPTGLDIASVHCGAVWGVERDDLGVSSVVRYGLNGGGGCGGEGRAGAM